MTWLEMFIILGVTGASCFFLSSIYIACRKNKPLRDYINMGLTQKDTIKKNAQSSDNVYETNDSIRKGSIK